MYTYIDEPLPNDNCPYLYYLLIMHGISNGQSCINAFLMHFVCHSIDESMDSHKIKYFAGFYVEFCLALKSKFTVVVISFHVVVVVVK